MLTPFRTLEEEIFPKVHCNVVHSLSQEGIKQSIIAEKLGITQAMVSKYLLKEKESSKIIDRLSETTLNSIKNNLSKEELTFNLTNASIKLMQSGDLCNICKKTNNLEECNTCMNLGISNNKDIIDNLKQATAIIEKANPIELIPEVSMNIAMCKSDAKNKSEVASIPGRIVKINNKLKASNQPQFNSSNHLANLLLKHKSENINAIINIKYNKEIDKAIKQANLNYIIIDKGSFGIEPSAYILGKDAIDVVNKAIKLQEVLRNQ